MILYGRERKNFGYTFLASGIFLLARFARIAKKILLTSSIFPSARLAQPGLQPKLALVVLAFRFHLKIFNCQKVPDLKTLLVLKNL
jgi:hypothetical protein